MGRSDDDRARARERAEKLGLGSAVITVALCGDEKTAKCATACEMKESWKHLRQLAKARRKEGLPRLVVLKLECPGVCRSGPIAAVFPGGVWYGGCDPKTLDDIIACHESTEPEIPRTVESKRIS